MDNVTVAGDLLGGSAEIFGTSFKLAMKGGFLPTLQCSGEWWYSLIGVVF